MWAPELLQVAFLYCHFLLLVSWPHILSYQYTVCVSVISYLPIYWLYAKYTSWQTIISAGKWWPWLLVISKSYAGISGFCKSMNCFKLMIYFNYNFDYLFICRIAHSMCPLNLGTITQYIQELQQFILNKSRLEEGETMWTKNFFFPLDHPNM